MRRGATLFSRLISSKRRARSHRTVLLATQIVPDRFDQLSTRKTILMPVSAAIFANVASASRLICFLKVSNGRVLTTPASMAGVRGQILVIGPRCTVNVEKSRIAGSDIRSRYGPSRR